MMYEKLGQGTKMVTGREKVLVPVRRCEAEKEAEQGTRVEPRIARQWEMPRRWCIY